MSNLEAVRTLVAAAYDKCLSRMDRRTSPLVHDYESDIREGTLCLVGNPIVGLISLKLDGEGDILLIENIAVHASSKGRGLDAG